MLMTIVEETKGEEGEKGRTVKKGGGGDGHRKSRDRG